MRSRFTNLRDWNKAAAGTVLVVLGLVLVAAPALRAESDDQRFVEALRQRRLFNLAETHLRERLADQQLADAQRGELTVELIRTLAQRAVHSAPAERDAAWQAARGAAAEFVERHPKHSRILLVGVQDALTVLARGELARQEAEIAARSGDALQRARDSVREAARMLEEIDKQLAQEIPLRNRTRPPPGELTADELVSLQSHVRYQLARAFRNQALSYPQGSNDQVAALDAALAQLDDVLTRVAESNPLFWQARIDRVVSLRRLGELTKATRFVAELRDKRAPPDVRQRGLAEAARLALAAGQGRQALALLSQGQEEIGDSRSAELDYAILQTYVRLWVEANKLKDKDAIAQWGEKSNEMVGYLERRHGAYWGRRGNLLLVAAAPRDAAIENMEIIARTADELYRKGQFDEAIEAYDRAEKMADEGGDAITAFELASKAAAVQYKLGRFALSAERFRRLAHSNPDNPGAGRAHLLAAYSLAVLARGDEAARTTYEELLHEHLDHWPKSSSSDDARLLLAKLYRSRGAWAEAIAAYEGMPNDSPKFPEAVNGAVDAWLAWLAELKSSGSAYADHAAAAAKFFESAIVGQQRQWPVQWTSMHRGAALAAARIRLQYDRGGYASAEQVLRAALMGEPPADDAWKADANALLVVAMAAQPDRRAEAKQALDILESSSAEQLLLTTELLARIGSAEEESSQQLAQLQLAAAELALRRAAELQAAQKLTVERLRADALAGVGKRDEALRVYEHLSQDNPQDGELQQGYAELLTAGGDRESTSKALDQWRRVARDSQRGSQRWHRAKYEVAHAQYRLDQKEEAARLIRFMQVTAPGFDDSRLKPKFLELLKLCEQ